MQFKTVLKLDLYKLLKKKTTYLLLLTLLFPLIFGIGMAAHISFLVTDGGSSFDVVSDGGISALQFTSNMLSQASYVVYLVIIIIVSMALANEAEAGQLRLYVVRICARPRMILSKFLALSVLTLSYLTVFCIFAVGIYYLFVSGSRYGSGNLLSGGKNAALYLAATYAGILVVISITMLLGLFLKTFHCFAAAYLIWFVAKYLSFFDSLKMAAPHNCADAILAGGIRGTEFVMWMGIYFIYICVVLIGSCYAFSHKDIQ